MLIEPYYGSVSSIDLRVRVEVEAAHVVASDGLLEVVGEDGSLNLALDSGRCPVLDHLVTEVDRRITPETNQCTLDPYTLVILDRVITFVGKAEVVSASTALVVDNLGMLV